jgi:hypothetical protein
MPFFDGLFDGAIYLAQPNDPATAAPGAENPFDSLVAVYLVAKLPVRGVLIQVAGKIAPNPTTGNLVATFDGLPQLAYTDLEMTFRPGQRAFLITPPRCGAPATRIQMTPWAVGPAEASASTPSAIETGVENGPCPTAAVPPFTPGAVAGGVNSNVGSYTPYFIHLSRGDAEQEITSYSRTKRGYAETASPSCPEASQVGRTLRATGSAPPSPTLPAGSTSPVHTTGSRSRW